MITTIIIIDRTVQHRDGIRQSGQRGSTTQTLSLNELHTSDVSPKPKHINQTTIYLTARGVLGIKSSTLGRVQQENSDVKLDGTVLENTRRSIINSVKKGIVLECC